jgi:hypothetical protein
MGTKRLDSGGYESSNRRAHHVPNLWHARWLRGLKHGNKVAEVRVTELPSPICVSAPGHLMPKRVGPSRLRTTDLPRTKQTIGHAEQAIGLGVGVGQLSYPGKRFLLLTALGLSTGDP